MISLPSSWSLILRFFSSKRRWSEYIEPPSSLPEPPQPFNDFFSPFHSFRRNSIQNPRGSLLFPANIPWIVDTITWSPTKNLLPPFSPHWKLITLSSHHSHRQLLKWIYIIRADLSLSFDVLYKEQIWLSHSSTKVKKKKNCLFFLFFNSSFASSSS